MIEAVFSILAVAGLALVAIGVYKGAPVMKQQACQHVIKNRVKAAACILLGLGYWVVAMIFLAMELQ